MYWRQRYLIRHCASSHLFSSKVVAQFSNRICVTISFTHACTHHVNEIDDRSTNGSNLTKKTTFSPGTCFITDAVSSANRTTSASRKELSCWNCSHRVEEKKIDNEQAFTWHICSKWESLHFLFISSSMCASQQVLNKIIAISLASFCSMASNLQANVKGIPMKRVPNVY